MGRDFLPFGLESIPATIDRLFAVGFQANLTSLVSAPMSQTAYYVCERIGAIFVYIFLASKKYKRS